MKKKSNEKETEVSDDVQIELFSTPNGVKAIKSPVRVKILSMLRKGDLSFDEIVKHSGRAKSTVSSHLKLMSKEGIISSRVDPDDARKKIFFIQSEYIGKLHRQQLQEDISAYIQRYIASENDPFEFFRLIFHTLRISLLSQGVDIDPILYEAGLKVGKALYEKVKDPDMTNFLGNIAAFWETHSLGSVEVKDLQPLTIGVQDCFECSGLPYLGRPACAFDSGILESLFSSYNQEEVKVTETECYALGDKQCSFVIE
ncbi:V4R domain-containing protein [Methanobacterium petrolearium]|uniref:V4R domain-containing protein n=1 Tax=Methanobacterium petrolearium TaxID=710190 RepID=UPI001FD77180|nr:V4R domain-containing protein [Methanobacterium petrolearium]MBP1945040.1 putative hydrocarbon binding protein [Methanobacterium petrolearium]